MSDMLNRFLQCCQSNGEAGNSELKVVQLSSDVLECHLAQPVHLLTQQDPFDMMLTPRAGFKGTDLSGSSPERNRTFTPRQRSLREQIWLPTLRRYPVPPTCSPEDPEDVRRAELLSTFQDFVMDLHKGIHLTQLNSNQDYSDIHCQIMEDLQTLKVDQGSGCIVEFPLGSVSKVYRIVKNDDKWYSAGTSQGPPPMPPLPLSNAEHIVVIEFMRRKLPFVFNDIGAAQRFLMFIELVIRRAQEISRAEDAQAAGGASVSGRFGVRRGAEGKSISPMFSGFTAPLGQPREPGERFARPLLPLSVARGDSRASAASSDPSPAI